MASNVHDVTDDCVLMHCYIHDVDEANGYQRCFECRHVYQTADELQHAWTAEAPPDMRDDPAPPVGDIYFCPHCFHDF